MGPDGGLHRRHYGRYGEQSMNLGRFMKAFRRKADLSEELESHLRMAVADRVARGESPAEASRAAMREFGNVPLVQDVTRDLWGWVWLERITEDFRYAVRQIHRSPGFAAAVIGTLAVGIGAAAAMFTVVDHVLLHPVPYRDPERLVQIQETDGKTGSWGAPWLDIEEWMNQSHSFSQVAMHAPLGGRNYLEGQDSAWEVNAQQVSANLFQVLGVAPQLGPGFAADRPSFTAGKNAGTIVLSDAVWKEAFGGNRSIMGRVVRIDDKTYTVVGVMPRGFTYPADAFDNRRTQVWIPVSLGDGDRSRDKDPQEYTVLARLHPGVPLEQARAEMTLIQKRVGAKYLDPSMRAQNAFVTLENYASTLVEADVRKALFALLMASGVLWLIAGVNATNLLLARSTARQREIAMRGALGASRGRVLQQMVVESLVLSGAAALLGTGLALGSVKLLGHELSQQLPLPAPATPDGLILMALLGMTIGSALMVALWPTVMAMRAPIEPALRQGGAQTGTGRRHHRMRGSLISLEVALSLTLLVACGLLLRTIYTLRRVPLGYRTDHIVVASLDIPAYRYTGRNIVQTLYEPLLDRLQRMHGSQSAGLISEVPLGHNFNIQLALRLNGNDVKASLKLVSPAIQQVFGLGMLAGRYFNEQDSRTSQPAVVVNPAFAREYAPDKHDPASLLGTTMWSLRKDAPFHVVGILNSERQESPSKPSQPEVDVCLCQITPDAGTYNPSTMAVDLAVRTERPTQEMIPEIRDVLRQASPLLENAPITTMDEIVEDSYGSQRLAAHLLMIFGGSALLLCIAGLYGLLTYVVTQRTREMGVRVALGAPRGKLLWLVMRQAAAMLVTGVVVGTGLVWASAQLLRGFLYGVQAHDGPTIAGAAALLLISGLLAAYLPACRAASVNPTEALRAE
jgi:predicted permease